MRVYYLVPLMILPVALFNMSGCSNQKTASRGGTKLQSKSTPIDDDILSTVVNASSPYSIDGNIISPALGAAASSPGISIIAKSLSVPPTPFSQSGLCPSVNSNYACICNFRWSANPAGGASSSNEVVSRHVTSEVLEINNEQITCAIPTAYNSNEMDGKTNIKFELTSLPGSGIDFRLGPAVFTPGGNSGASLGNHSNAGFCNSTNSDCFANIERYSCFDRLKLFSGSITNQTTWIGGSFLDSESAAYQANPSATRHCWTDETGQQRNANESSRGQDDTTKNTKNSCPSNSAYQAKQTAQSYYYNLYARPFDRAKKDVENSGFVCPRVSEPLEGSTASQWPEDVTFTLAIDESSNFPIRVRAQSYLGDSVQGSADIIADTIGYAAPPNSDGSCGTVFAKVDGKTVERQMYRLRRYVAYYPPRFDVNGSPIATRLPALDDSYVLDRPVRIGGGSNSTMGAMRGPKPCSFALYDHYGALFLDRDPNDEGQPPSEFEPYPRGRPAWMATNHMAEEMPLDNCNANNVTSRGLYCDKSWSGVNSDGLKIPNVDHLLAQPNFTTDSCASMVQLTRFDDQGIPVGFDLATTHLRNQFLYCTDGPCGSKVLNGAESRFDLHEKFDNVIELRKIPIRPAKKWHPEYVEDDSFRACALPPLDKDYKDAPLHVVQSNEQNGQMTWCAASYPTQHRSMKELDPLNYDEATSVYNGYIIPFTSPAIKNVNYGSIGITKSATSCTLNSSLANPPPGRADCKSQDPKWTSFSPAGHPSDLTIDQKIAVDGSAENLCAYETCDRTVTDQRGLVDTDYKIIPLQAPPKDIERMLKEDSNYSCEITWDGKSKGEGSKVGRSPASGCCYNGLLDFQTDPSQAAAPEKRAAHVQPFPSSAIPLPATKEIFGTGCGIPNY